MTFTPHEFWLLAALWLSVSFLAGMMFCQILSDYIRGRAERIAEEEQ